MALWPHLHNTHNHLYTDRLLINDTKPRHASDHHKVRVQQQCMIGQRGELDG